MALHMCIGFFSEIGPGVDPGRGKNTSVRSLFSKGLFLLIQRLQQQTECIAVILKHIYYNLVIFGQL